MANSIYAVDDLASKWIKISAIDWSSEWIKIQVTDSGEGIPDITAKKIMEPFYTTKPVSEGSGLGLSIVKNLIENQRGFIEYRTENGHTNFNLFFQKPQKQEEKAA